MNPSTIFVGSRVAQANPASIDRVTGIDTAAVVLAVLPLLIQAFSAYNSGLEKTGIILGLTKNKQNRYKVEVERIRIRLEWERADLHLDLLKLSEEQVQLKILHACPSNMMTYSGLGKLQKR